MSKRSELSDRINAYLSIGGVFNPELANHDYVRDLIIDCATALRELEAERDRYRESFAAERETRQNIESRLAALEGEGDD